MHNAWRALFWRHRSGFTAVELILTLGIFAILAAVTAPLLGNLQMTETLDSHAENVLDALRRAQQRTVTGERDSKWGVHCATSSYTLFAGESYASRSMQFDEVHNLQGGYTCAGLTDIIFTPVTGTPSSSGVFTISHPATGTMGVRIGSGGTLLLQ